MPASQGTQQGGLGGIRRISDSPGQAVIACNSMTVRLTSAWSCTQLLIDVPNNLANSIFVWGLTLLEWRWGLSVSVITHGLSCQQGKFTTIVGM